MSVRKFFSLKTFSIAVTTALLVACGSSNTIKTQIPTTSNGSDPQQFGAKYSGRNYQQAVFMSVSQVENQSAVINQGDFLTQLSNVQSYSSKLSDRFYGNYEKITNWVLSGANVSELSNLAFTRKLCAGSMDIKMF